MINPKTAMFGAISIIHQRLYSVKTVTSLSVLCAFPSYSVYVRLVAATGDFGIEGTLFLIFFWQFPIFGQLVGSCMKIMKRQVFYVANRQDKGTAGYFV
jgi:hypothetical protein